MTLRLGLDLYYAYSKSQENKIKVGVMISLSAYSSIM